jgi:hypothetical protein
LQVSITLTESHNLGRLPQVALHETLRYWPSLRAWAYDPGAGDA